MTRSPRSDEPDEHDDLADPEVVGDNEVERTGDDSVAFEIIDMVALLGADYALGFEIVDGEYSEVLQAHRYLGPRRGFELVRDADLIDQLAALSVLHDDDDEPEDDDAIPEPREALVYAIVDTVAVDGVTWTLGRTMVAPEDTAPDVYRYDGHGKSFELANGVDAALRARIEDEVRGFEQDDVTYERVDFDLRQILEHDGQTYAIGYPSDDESEAPTPRVWRHLGDGLGFELVDLASTVHREVLKKFPGLFDDED